ATLITSCRSTCAASGRTTLAIACGLTASTTTSESAASAKFSWQAMPNWVATRSRCPGDGSTARMAVASWPLEIRPPMRPLAMLPAPMKVIFMCSPPRVVRLGPVGSAFFPAQEMPWPDADRDQGAQVDGGGADHQPQHEAYASKGRGLQRDPVEAGLGPQQQGRHGRRR